MTYDPLLLLLNHHDKKERDRLTEKWKDNKLQELSFVGVVVSSRSQYSPRLTAFICSSSLTLLRRSPSYKASKEDQKSAQ